jgi:hypothetical protein
VKRWFVGVGVSAKDFVTSWSEAKFTRIDSRKDGALPDGAPTHL